MRIRHLQDPGLRPSGFKPRAIRAAEGWHSTAAVVEFDTYYEVRMSVRGVDPDRLRVEVRDEVVVVTGRRGSQETGGSGPVFQRVVGLPSGASRAGATARLDADRLVIRLPRVRQGGECAIALGPTTGRVAGR